MSPSTATSLRERAVAREQTRAQRRRRILARVLLAALLAGLLLATAGWLLLRGLPETVLGFLFAAGGGGMFYLTATDLIPNAEEWQYQQSAALAMAVGFMVIFVLSSPS